MLCSSSLSLRPYHAMPVHTYKHTTDICHTVTITITYFPFPSIFPRTITIPYHTILYQTILYVSYLSTNNFPFLFSFWKYPRWNIPARTNERTNERMDEILEQRDREEEGLGWGVCLVIMIIVIIIITVYIYLLVVVILIVILISITTLYSTVQ